MARSLLLLPLLCLAAKPELNLNFAGQVRGFTPGVGPTGPVLETLVVNVPNQFFEIKQLIMPFNKTVGMGVDCKGNNGSGVENRYWPYFDGTLCYSFATGLRPGDCHIMDHLLQVLPLDSWDKALFNRTEKVGLDTLDVYLNLKNYTVKVGNENVTFFTGFEFWLDGSQLRVWGSGQGRNAPPTSYYYSAFTDIVVPAPTPEVTGSCIDLYSVHTKTLLSSFRMFYPSHNRSLVGAVNDLAIIDHANAHQRDWKAGLTEFMAGKSYDEVSRLLGTYMVPHPEVLKTLSSQYPASLRARVPPNMAIPTSFDARTEWPQCKSIGTVRNQGGCGSCWAFGATESAEDRLCIASNGTWHSLLAPQYLVQCDAHDGGCGGGFLDTAWQAIQHIGLVVEGCAPYEYCDYDPFANCTAPPNTPPKPTPKPPKCGEACADGTALKAFKAKDIYPVALPGDAEAIQRELLANGPIEVAFFVFADFMQYKSGVYSHTSNGVLGGHAVKLLGWGEEAGVPYWLCANSWSPDWGDHGYFKILRGSDECGIESMATAGLMDF